jgi:hypothetical protein
MLHVPAIANDEQIAKQIAERLQAQKSASNLTDFNIGIQVDQGTVTMMGQVADSQQAITALDVARRVPGVKLVVNDLYVRQSASGPTNVAAAPVPQQATIQPVSAQLALPTQPVVAGNIAGMVPAPPAIGAGALNQLPATMNLSQAPTNNLAPSAPLAFAPSRSIRAAQPAAGQAQRAQYSYEEPAQMGGPMAMPIGSSEFGGAAQANYDQPQMPGYAWPSYAAYPNYAALTYPHQYSPTAWPYIGPFYPYPQVPLGWRKVVLEWDDGWWWLDFKAK